MTPLIDVVFQLLIFLLVATKFTKPEAVVDLPSGPKTAEAQTLPDRKALSLAISAQGEIMHEAQAISLEQLPAVIREHLAAGQISRVEIRGDQASHFGVFVKLFETTRQAGIQSVAIVKEIADSTPTDAP